MIPRVLLVTSPACHYCDDAHGALAALDAAGQVELETLEADTAEAAAVIGIHRPAMFPLVLVDGEFLSAGRLSRGKLARALGVDRSVV